MKEKNYKSGFVRTLVLCAALVLLASCRSHKEITRTRQSVTDSVAYSESWRSGSVMDSLFRRLDFAFDSLAIDIERPYPPGDTVLLPGPEIIRFRAVNGRLSDHSGARRDSTGIIASRDSAASHRSSSSASETKAESVRLGNPPDGTATVIVIILSAAALIYFIRRRK